MQNCRKKFVTGEQKMKKYGVFILALAALSGIMFGCAQKAPAVRQAEPAPAAAQPAPPPAAVVDEGVVIEPNPGPGPYTGRAQGYHGVVEVTLEVKDRVIVSASAADEGETVGIGTLAVDNMPGMMVNANSIEVDTVSGATISSLAVLEAAAKALGKAGLTNADLKR
jgi:fumarate reductase flavoprotein subunit